MPTSPNTKSGLLPHAGDERCCLPLRAERKRQGEQNARPGCFRLAHPANNAPTRQKKAAKEIETGNGTICSAPLLVRPGLGLWRG